MNRTYRILLTGCALLTATALQAADITAKPAATANRPAVPAPKARASTSTEPRLRPATLSVAQIVERNATARGGLEAWRKINSMSMVGKMDAGRARQIRPEDYAPGHKRPLTGPFALTCRASSISGNHVSARNPRNSATKLRKIGCGCAATMVPSSVAVPPRGVVSAASN